MQPAPGLILRSAGTPFGEHLAHEGDCLLHGQQVAHFLFFEEKHDCEDTMILQSLGD